MSESVLTLALFLSILLVMALPPLAALFARLLRGSWIIEKYDAYIDYWVQKGRD